MIEAFGSSWKGFYNLCLSSTEKFQKLFGNVRVACRQFLDNLRKTS